MTPASLGVAMLLSLILSLLSPDPCRTYTVYSDPDRALCPVLQDGGPTWTWGDGGG